MDGAAIRGLCRVNCSRRIGEKTRVYSIIKSVVNLHSLCPLVLLLLRYATGEISKSEQQRRVTKAPCSWIQKLKEAFQGNEIYLSDYDEPGNSGKKSC